MRRALMTGASRGIGRALVTGLVARGLEVVATARRAGDLAGLAAAERLQLDVTSDASVAAAAELAGPVDLLVNNAAISAAATVEDTPAGVAVAMFGTNVVGPLRVISAFVPGMRERGGGTVVNVSSAAGQGTRPPTEASHGRDGSTERSGRRCHDVRDNWTFDVARRVHRRRR